MSGATRQPRLSRAFGSSAVCTSPLRPKSVTDAGCGMLASALLSPSVGRMTRARVGESAATRSATPAPGSHVEGVRDPLVSEGATDGARVESFVATGLSRRQATAATRSQSATTVEMRRNCFIRFNLDRPEPASTADILRRSTYRHRARLLVLSNRPRRRARRREKEVLGEWFMR